MLNAPRQDERRPSPVKHACNVPHDQAVARLVGAKPVHQLVEVLLVDIVEAGLRETRHHNARKRLLLANHSLSHSVANRPALHEHDGLQSVGALRRSRKPMHVTGLHRSHDLLEAEGRHVVAFVADHHSIRLHEASHAFLTRKVALLEQGRNKRDVDNAARQAFPSANLTDNGTLLPAFAAGRRQQFRQILVNAEKLLETIPPLFEQCHLLYKNERAHLAACDQVGGDHRLAERRRSNQHADVTCRECLDCGHLLGPQRTLKFDLDRLSLATRLFEHRLRTARCEQLRHRVLASSRQPDPVASILVEVQYPLLAVHRLAHGLRAVEVRVSECGHTPDPVDRRSRQALFRHEQQVRTHDAHQRGHVPWSQLRASLRSPWQNCASSTALARRCLRIEQLARRRGVCVFQIAEDALTEPP